MLPNTITQDIHPEANASVGLRAMCGTPRSYPLRTLSPTSSMYSEISAAIDTPRLLRVTHETTGKGIINSAIIIDQEIDSGSADVPDSVARLLLKLSYDPSFATKATLKQMLLEIACHLIEGALSDEGLTAGTLEAADDGDLLFTLQLADNSGISLNQFLNQEH